MPLFFQQEIDRDTKLAVWRIAESEAFFDVPLQRIIHHPFKRLQHKAGRCLLRHLDPHFPIEKIEITDNGKPFLKDRHFYFSISHCDDWAAAIVSESKSVGIDVEKASPKLERVQHKFLTDAEYGLLKKLEPLSRLHLLLLAWSAKEAAFKWYGKGSVDFKEDMPLKKIRQIDAGFFQSHMLFGKEVNKEIIIESRFFENVCLSYIVS